MVMRRVPRPSCFEQASDLIDQLASEGLVEQAWRLDEAWVSGYSREEVLTALKRQAIQLQSSEATMTAETRRMLEIFVETLDQALGQRLEPRGFGSDDP